MKKTTIFRPSLGRPQRAQGDSPRIAQMHADFTRQEAKVVHEYCDHRGISVSQFLAESIMEEAQAHKKREQQEVILSLTIPGEEPQKIRFPIEQMNRLKLLARSQKKPILNVLLDRLKDALPMQPRNASKAAPLRYYVSHEEHRIISDYIARTGVSARAYVALLAMKKIAETTG